MQKLRVGVLRGGGKDNYASSIDEGGEILSYLYENLGEAIQPIDILVDKDGLWHHRGVPIMPTELPHRVDIVWNTTYGNPASILGSLSIPTIGASSFVGALSRNRELLCEHLKTIDIHMPRSILLPVYQEDFDGRIDQYISKKAREVWQKFSPPWIVSSVSNTKNIAQHVVKTFPELVSVISGLVYLRQGILIEEFIHGKIASVHSIPGFRGEEFYSLPSSSINAGMFSLGGFSNEEKVLLRRININLHKHLGHCNYTQTTFLLTPKGKIYLKNINFHPDFKSHSHLDATLDAFGIKREEVISHMLNRVIML